jgi:hypothetical protein
MTANLDLCLLAVRVLFHANTYCDTGPRFTQFHPENRHWRPKVRFEPGTQGSSDLCASVLTTVPCGRLTEPHLKAVRDWLVDSICYDNWGKILNAHCSTQKRFINVYYSIQKGLWYLFNSEKISLCSFQISQLWKDYIVFIAQHRKDVSVFCIYFSNSVRKDVLVFIA